MFISLSCEEPDDPILIIKNPLPGVKKLLEEHSHLKCPAGDWMIRIKLEHIELVAALFVNMNTSTCTFLEKLRELLLLL